MKFHEFIKNNESIVKAAGVEEDVKLLNLLTDKNDEFKIGYIVLMFFHMAYSLKLFGFYRQEKHIEGYELEREVEPLLRFIPFAYKMEMGRARGVMLFSEKELAAKYSFFGSWYQRPSDFPSNRFRQSFCELEYDAKTSAQLLDNAKAYFYLLQYKDSLLNKGDEDGD